MPGSVGGVSLVSPGWRYRWPRSTCWATCRQAEHCIHINISTSKALVFQHSGAWLLMQVVAATYHLPRRPLCVLASSVCNACAMLAGRLKLCAHSTD